MSITDPAVLQLAHALAALVRPPIVGLASRERVTAAPGGAAARYVLIPRAAAITGCSIKAIESKIECGQWVEGREWRKAPDGHRLIDMRGYEAWVERGMA